jgi:hypothetical protein
VSPGRESGGVVCFVLDEHLDDFTHCPFDLDDKDLLLIAKKDGFPVIHGQNTTDLHLDNVLSHGYNLYPSLKNHKHPLANSI